MFLVLLDLSVLLQGVLLFVWDLVFVGALLFLAVLLLLVNLLRFLLNVLLLLVSGSYIAHTLRPFVQVGEVVACVAEAQ